MAQHATEASGRFTEATKTLLPRPGGRRGVRRVGRRASRSALWSVAGTLLVVLFSGCTEREVAAPEPAPTWVPVRFAASDPGFYSWSVNDSFSRDEWAAWVVMGPERRHVVEPGLPVRVPVEMTVRASRSDAGPIVVSLEPGNEIRYRQGRTADSDQRYTLMATTTEAPVLRLSRVMDDRDRGSFSYTIDVTVTGAWDTLPVSVPTVLELRPNDVLQFADDQGGGGALFLIDPAGGLVSRAWPDHGTWALGPDAMAGSYVVVPLWTDGVRVNATRELTARGGWFETERLDPVPIEAGSLVWKHTFERTPWSVQLSVRPGSGQTVFDVGTFGPHTLSIEHLGRTVAVDRSEGPSGSSVSASLLHGLIGPGTYTFRFDEEGDGSGWMVVTAIYAVGPE